MKEKKESTYCIDPMLVKKNSKKCMKNPFVICTH